MTDDWTPKEMTKSLDVQVAFDDERIHFRFRWDQPDPGGWLHDLLVYRDGEWHNHRGPSPWVAKGDHDHEGFYEDRLSFLLGDGSVTGFEEFGGWLTAHAEGMRTLPGEAPETEVREHHHYGDDGLGRTDIRKYIPHACAGEWWENDWREVRPEEELAQLKSEGVFLDLPMWRAYRSDPLGYGTDHHILDYRHSDQGQNTYTTQEFDPEDGPELMFDPEVVEGGALNYEEISAGNFPEQGEDTYGLVLDDAVEFDPSVAEWEGAAIPRRPLQQPHGSAADWLAEGTWEDGEWTVEMSRDLETDHPADTKQLEPGESYVWTPAVHHGVGTRWHWVGFPYRLGLGVEPTYPGEADDGRAELVAEEFEGEEPDWDETRTYTLPLIFPGLFNWSDMVGDHPRAEEIRNAEITMWDLYEKDPSEFVEQ